MADSTITSSNVILLDKFPGVPVNMNLPPGFADTTNAGDMANYGHNVATAIYKPGTKIQIYHEGAIGVAGFSTFIYLQASSNSVVVAKSLVTPAAAGAPYTVTTIASGAVGLGYGPAAIACSAVTATYYGWFWCGGVCPCDYVAAFVTSTAAGTLVTNGLVAVGGMSVGTLIAGTTITLVPTATVLGTIGIASSADA
jgi:hypothetical protein